MLEKGLTVHLSLNEEEMDLPGLQLVWPGVLPARAELLLLITIVTITQCMEMHLVSTSVMFKAKYTETQESRCRQYSILKELCTIS